MLGVVETTLLLDEIVFVWVFLRTNDRLMFSSIRWQWCDMWFLWTPELQV